MWQCVHLNSDVTRLRSKTLSRSGGKKHNRCLFLTFCGHVGLGLKEIDPILQFGPAVNFLLSPAASLIKSTLTRKTLYSLYGRVLVGEVHKSIAGFEQDLVGHWKVVLPEELLQVLDGDRRT